MNSKEKKLQINWREKSDLKYESIGLERLSAFNKLIDEATEYLELIVKADIIRIGSFLRIWKQARTLMAKHKIYQYDENAAESILYHKYGEKPLGLLTSGEWRFRKAINLLTEFSKNKKMTVYIGTRRKKNLFEGALGQTILFFFQYLIDEKALSRHTVRVYETYLSLFFKYCITKRISSAEEISLPIIIGFITDPQEKSLSYRIVCYLRVFMRYLHEKGISGTDLSKKIPVYKKTIQIKLPSIYQKEEVEKLIYSTPRSSAIEKRNYVIVLLAARLGLRAGDIAALKLSDLDWENNTITMIQSKTGREVSLPLLPAVGNAIIDYLKYARPKSEDPYLLLYETSPYNHFTNSGVITHVIQRAFLKSGISVQGRRFGPHALRHSLGYRLLQGETSISVISEVLGHKNSETTKKYYLKIDLNSMEPCALEVTPISRDFYEQLGGIFYDKTT